MADEIRILDYLIQLNNNLNLEGGYISPEIIQRMTIKLCERALTKSDQLLIDCQEKFIKLRTKIEELEIENQALEDENDMLKDQIFGEDLY